MFIHNEFVGSRAAINVFEYPTRGEEYRLIASYTERTERKFLFSFRNLFLPGGRFSLEATVGFFKNGTARFFGIGGQTSPAQETNYTDRELLGHITTGLYVGPSQRVLWTERLRNVEIQPGVVPDLPFTQSVFPAVKGTGGAAGFGHPPAFFNDTPGNQGKPPIRPYLSMFLGL